MDIKKLLYDTLSKCLTIDDAESLTESLHDDVKTLMATADTISVERALGQTLKRIVRESKDTI